MKSTNLVVVVVAVLLLTLALASGEIRNKGWWKNMVFYQVYPRSFMDANNDGNGDLKGITSKLEHFKETEIGAIWLSPINRSPMRDNGYDISNFTDVNEMFGTLDDFDELVKKAKELGIKVILDFVPNHTSDQHEWFQMSVKGTGKYKDYYIWSDGKVEGEKRVPPNNWVSVFNNSAWTFNEERKQYYFHQFYKEQPDLNYNNPDVKDAIEDVMRFWLKRGVDGFRIDAVPHLIEGDITKDEPFLNITGVNPTDHANFEHTLTKDQPGTYELVKRWRAFVDNYADQNKEDEKVLLTEAYTSLENTIKYYRYGSHIPFNFNFIMSVNSDSSAAQFKNIIDNWMKSKSSEDVPNWVMGNHDRNRLATRYPGRADQMMMLEMILPGVAVTYYGEEIGMEDKTFPKDEKHDFRDGCRTPFQWDNTTNAGFSKNLTTWLPVHDNYKELNLAKQKNDPESTYKLYKELMNLRKSDVLKFGQLYTDVLNDDVLAIVRSLNSKTIALLMNFSKQKNVTVNLSKLVQHNNGEVKLTSLNAPLRPNTVVEWSKVTVPVNASIVLSASSSNIPKFSAALILLMALVLLFRS